MWNKTMSAGECSSLRQGAKETRGIPARNSVGEELHELQEVTQGLRIRAVTGEILVGAQGSL